MSQITNIFEHSGGQCRSRTRRSSLCSALPGTPVVLNGHFGAEKGIQLGWNFIPAGVDEGSGSEQEI